MAISCKPLLDDEAAVRGYVELHETEARQTQLSLDAMPDAVHFMHRYLTVLDDLLRGEHECGAGANEGELACQLRLRLAVLSASTMKNSLDMALGGYYSPAFALVRHLLESWQVMAYLRVNPSASRQWFERPVGGLQPLLPNQQTMANRVRNPGPEFSQLRSNSLVIERLVARCNDGAHPSMLGMLASDIGRQDYGQLGGNFQGHFLRNWIDVASVSFALVINEISHTLQVDDQAREEIARIHTARNAWFESEHGESDTPPAKHVASAADASESTNQQS